MTRDAVDVVLEQWARARPDLDAPPMGVLGRLSRLTRIVERELKALFEEFGLERGEFDVLATLRRAGSSEGMTAGALARSSMVTSGAVTNRLDRLVAKGYVTRDVDPANRRTVIVALTPTGRDLIDRAVAAHVENERRLLAALDDNQQNDLAATLRTLLLSLGDEAQPATDR
ncbi:MarR family winged helix-turn-helix transcriptional regulator [Actinomadura madurae]|uniref:MarR family winged helix-turn-helix transcriptional regulator n=1 Tax=Actinomadura madurae TaxID=1993 RepID=UPI0020D20CBC|nr:MarR family transcriptional regulator [Actinomadura madurae]MCP9949323.1 MarR family transcriptional regulator [Actinomadura madurae]MCP9966080.1 MarR family transcriptional regulator [Actinomadura madurae]MCP9978565.1 MarR family transcriptional regulator [Actinomadura madurae]MCQ0009907.1 MarR family transcriptional regulator [Actinomadura madurae]